mmetsp:Transcript_2993/g.9199  ORF Transcript_2993/g.9199 Transcript_2993/m.9199 type:complete len:235 (+) Transcript_2993:675-1379(+)
MNCGKYLLAAPPSPVCSTMSSKMQMATRRSSEDDCSLSSCRMYGSSRSKYGCSCDLRHLASVPMHSLTASSTSLSASCSACSSSRSSSSKSSVLERSMRSVLRSTDPLSTSSNCTTHASSCVGSSSTCSLPPATSSAGGHSTCRHSLMDSSSAQSSSLSLSSSTTSSRALTNAQPRFLTHCALWCAAVALPFLTLRAAATSSSGSVCAAALRTSSWKKNLTSGIIISATCSMYG